MTQVRLNLDEYSIRVLDVVKGKYGLKNREQALHKFVQNHGNEYVELPKRKLLLRDLDARYNHHVKKYGTKSMSDKELDDLLGL